MHNPKIELTLTPAGRQVTFSKELLEVAHVFRRVGGEAGRWLRVAVNYRSPYLHTDVFAPGTRLEYYVQHESQQGDSEGRSHVVSTDIAAAQPVQSPASGPDDIPLGNQRAHTQTIPLMPPIADEPVHRE